METDAPVIHQLISKTEKSALLFLTLLLHINRSRTRDHLHKTSKETTAESLRVLILLIPENGTFYYQISYAKDRGTQERIISNLGKEKYYWYQKDKSTNEEDHKTRSQSLLILLRYHGKSTIPLLLIPCNRIFLPITKSEAQQVLKLNNSATSREITCQFRILAQKFYLDKWDKTKPFLKDKATKMLKSISNTKNLLLD